MRKIYQSMCVMYLLVYTTVLYAECSFKKEKTGKQSVYTFELINPPEEIESSDAVASAAEDHSAVSVDKKVPMLSCSENSTKKYAKDSIAEWLVSQSAPSTASDFTSVEELEREIADLKDQVLVASRSQDDKNLFDGYQSITHLEFLHYYLAAEENLLNKQPKLDPSPISSEQISTSEAPLLDSRDKEKESWAKKAVRKFGEMAVRGPSSMINKSLTKYMHKGFDRENLQKMLMTDKDVEIPIMLLLPPRDDIQRMVGMIQGTATAAVGMMGLTMNAMTVGGASFISPVILGSISVAINTASELAKGGRVPKSMQTGKILATSPINAVTSASLGALLQNEPTLHAFVPFIGPMWMLSGGSLLLRDSLRDLSPQEAQSLADADEIYMGITTQIIFDKLIQIDLLKKRLATLLLKIKHKELIQQSPAETDKLDYVADMMKVYSDVQCVCEAEAWLKKGLEETHIAQEARMDYLHGYITPTKIAEKDEVTRTFVFPYDKVQSFRGTRSVREKNRLSHSAYNELVGKLENTHFVEKNGIREFGADYDKSIKSYVVTVALSKTIEKKFMFKQSSLHQLQDESYKEMYGYGAHRIVSEHPDEEGRVKVSLMVSRSRTFYRKSKEELDSLIARIQSEPDTAKSLDVETIPDSFGYAYDKNMFYVRFNRKFIQVERRDEPLTKAASVPVHRGGEPEEAYLRPRRNTVYVLPRQVSAEAKAEIRKRLSSFETFHLPIP